MRTEIKLSDTDTVQLNELGIKISKISDVTDVDAGDDAGNDARVLTWVEGRAERTVNSGNVNTFDKVLTNLIMLCPGATCWWI